MLHKAHRFSKDQYQETTKKYNEFIANLPDIIENVKSQLKQKDQSQSIQFSMDQLHIFEEYFKKSLKEIHYDLTQIGKRKKKALNILSLPIEEITKSEIAIANIESEVNKAGIILQNDLTEKLSKSIEDEMRYVESIESDNQSRSSSQLSFNSEEISFSSFSQSPILTSESFIFTTTKNVLPIDSKQKIGSLCSAIIERQTKLKEQRKETTKMEADLEEMKIRFHEEWDETEKRVASLHQRFLSLKEIKSRISSTRKSIDTDNEEIEKNKQDIEDLEHQNQIALRDWKLNSLASQNLEKAKLRIQEKNKEYEASQKKCDKKKRKIQILEEEVGKREKEVDEYDEYVSSIEKKLKDAGFQFEDKLNESSQELAALDSISQIRQLSPKKHFESIEDELSFVLQSQIED